jgi:N-acetyl-gamma-glutamyl-phosphate reductase
MTWVSGDVKPKVFIDGEHGTTGLQIRERLAQRSDLEFIHLNEPDRKLTRVRADALNAADIAILCLPDEAAIEAVSLVENGRTRIIDASSAHRTAPDWTYGFPEMTPGQAKKIAEAKRVSNPGCYATGAVALLRPLIQAELLRADHPVSINAISGYSGGGKPMIAAFEDETSKDFKHRNFRLYGLGLEHKHTEEICVHSGLTHRPLFVPSVGRFRQGMLVQVPLQLWALPGRPRPAELHSTLGDAYDGTEFVEVPPYGECLAIGGASALDTRNPEPEAVNGSDKLRLFVFGNDKREQAVLVALLDNLGKGAAGQAVQCLDLMLGV